MEKLKEKPNKSEKISKISTLIKELKTKIFYIQIWEKNDFWLTPYWRRFWWWCWFIDENNEFIIEPKYTAISDFTSDWLVRCWVPDYKLMWWNILNDEIRNFKWELLQIIDKNSDDIIHLKVLNPKKLEKSEQIPPREATWILTIRNRIPIFLAWIKTQEELEQYWKSIPLKTHENFIEIQIIAEKLFKLINWSSLVKRKAATRPEILKKIISNALKTKQAIPIFQYWWVWTREQAWENEKRCLENLNNTFSEIEKIYSPWVSLDLIFCDTHMELNWFWKSHREKYLESIKWMFKEHNWNISYMSKILWISPENFYKKIQENIYTYPIPDELKAELLKSASSKQRSDYEISALEYWTANMLEKEVLNEKFKWKIFLSFNDNKFDNLFWENLPILHWYPIKKWLNNKPWFMN